MSIRLRTRSIRRTIRGIPGIPRLWNRVQHVEHRLRLGLSPRENRLYTQFCRVPAQLRALTGPVWETLAPHVGDDPLRIVVFGCSTGAEPYSISWALQHWLPTVRFTVECYDIDPAVVAVAQAARYSDDEVLKNKLLPSDFLASALDPRPDGFIVKPAVAAPVTFQIGNVLDPSLINRVRPADVVFAQNFLFHLDRQPAQLALRHLISLLKPTAALFVDGADLDIRTRVTAEARLHPLEYELERIHEEALVERGGSWPEIYWGLEPLDRRRADRVRRYATIFLRTS